MNDLTLLPNPYVCEICGAWKVLQHIGGWGFGYDVLFCPHADDEQHVEAFRKAVERFCKLRDEGQQK